MGRSFSFPPPVANSPWYSIAVRLRIISDIAQLPARRTYNPEGKSGSQYWEKFYNNYNINILIKKFNI
jgi:hypothetical protein